MGSTVPVRIRTTTTRTSVSQAARRHGRLIHGAAATITAAAPAISAGPGNAALASHEPRARFSVSASGCWSPSRSKIPAASPAATTPARASLPSRPNRRCRSVAATTSTAAAAHATCTMPVRTRLAEPDPRLSATGALGLSNHRDAAAETISAQASRTLPEIRRITSPG